MRSEGEGEGWSWSGSHVPPRWQSLWSLHAEPPRRSGAGACTPCIERVVCKADSRYRQQGWPEVGVRVVGVRVGVRVKERVRVSSIGGESDDESGADAAHQAVVVRLVGGWVTPNGKRRGNLGAITLACIAGVAGRPASVRVSLVAVQVQTVRKAKARRPRTGYTTAWATPWRLACTGVARERRVSAEPPRRTDPTRARTWVRWGEGGGWRGWGWREGGRGARG